MITSSAEDLTNIKNTINCISFLSQIFDETSSLDFNNLKIDKPLLEDLLQYYIKLYNILNTSGMTLDQYQDYIESSPLN